MGKGEKLERLVSAVRHLDSGNGVSPRDVHRYLSEQDKETSQDGDFKLLLQTAVKDGFVEARGSRLFAAAAHTSRYDEELRRIRAEISFLADQVRQRTDELEQFQRLNSLRIYGLPETTGEQTDQLVVEMCRHRLGVRLRPWHIERSHRVGRRRPPAPRPLLVRFCSYRYRRRVFGRKRRLKGTGITIVEDLTPGRLEMLHAARDRFGVRNAWTNDGNVFWKQGGEVKRAARLQDVIKPDKIDECNIPASTSEAD